LDHQISVACLGVAVSFRFKELDRYGMTCMHPAMVCGALTMPGIRAGTGAIIGAGSLVSYDLPDFL